MFHPTSLFPCKGIVCKELLKKTCKKGRNLFTLKSKHFLLFLFSFFSHGVLVPGKKQTHFSHREVYESVTDMKKGMARKRKVNGKRVHEEENEGRVSCILSCKMREDESLSLSLFGISDARLCLGRQEVRT